MMRAKLIETGLRLKNGKALLNRNVALQVLCTPRMKSIVVDTKKKVKDEHLDEPIKFSTSPAATWPAAYTRAANLTRPWYQGLVITASFAVLLVYFAILREENDIDEKIGGNVHSNINEFMTGIKSEGERNKNLYKMP